MYETAAAFKWALLRVEVLAIAQAQPCILVYTILHRSEYRVRPQYIVHGSVLASTSWYGVGMMGFGERSIARLGLGIVSVFVPAIVSQHGFHVYAMHMVHSVHSSTLCTCMYRMYKKYMRRRGTYLLYLPKDY